MQLRCEDPTWPGQCDSVTGYLCNFEVYTGQGNVKDGTPKGVIHRLIVEAGLAGAIGRILCTDNVYTSRDVMLHVYLTFGFLMVGTYALTKKKSRTAADFPFHRLSNGAMKKIERGWHRLAFQKVVSKGRHLFTMQATVWKDKKVVGFLHNHLVQPCADDFVERFSPRRKKKRKVVSHAVTSDYIEHFNGVDHKDRDTADWTVSLKSNRFYLRIFYWCLDSIIHAMFVIAVSQCCNERR